MAIQINTNVETAEGFTIKPFCYLYIQIYAPNFSNCVLQYWKSEQDYIDGKSSLTIPTLPSVFNAEITQQEFWGTELAMIFHNKAIALIEETLGADTCRVVQ
jgi:hypothetical protein